MVEIYFFNRVSRILSFFRQTRNCWVNSAKAVNIWYLLNKNTRIKINYLKQR